MKRHGYTLVEVLAVTVLLGLIASLGVPPLLRSIAGDPLNKAAERLALAFRDARAQAHGHRLRLGLGIDGFTTVSLDARDDGVRTALPTARLAESIQASWSRNGRSVQVLELDPGGHGPDTDLALRQGNRTLLFTIDGLTGMWTPKAQP